MLKKMKSTQIPATKVGILTIIFFLAIIGMNSAATKLNESVLDFRLNYTSVDAYHFFQHLGGNGRQFYFVLLLFDFFFPIIYMLFGVNLALFVINKQKDIQNWQTIFIFFPIFGMIFDWIENIIILLMLHSYDTSFLDLAVYSSTVTLLKFSFLGIFIISLTIITIKNFMIKHHHK